MLNETGDLPTEAEVVVLGAGIAGHCAALEAAEAGAEVLFLEKASQAGGSSAIAGGGFVFSGTDLQIAAGVADDLALLRRDLFESGKGRNNPLLVDLFVRTQLETYEFLRRHGAKFEFATSMPPAISRLHTTGTGRVITNLHMAARAHPKITYSSKSAGFRLHRAASTAKVESVSVLFGSELREIAVAGGVVLATGGFSRSTEILRTYAPELADAVKHGGTANTGDGLMIATDLGAAHADLGYVTGSFGGAIRNYPNVEHDPDEIPPLIFSFLRGGVIVNKHGKRFVNEGQSYKKIGTIGMEQPEGIGFQIFDSKLMDQSNENNSVNNFRDGLIAGYIQEAATIAEAAVKMGIDPDVLCATISRYNAGVQAGMDPDFGRAVGLVAVDTPPYYIAATANAVTSTYGGLAANDEMAVLDWFGEPIPGLFAAGEVVGGFHGAGYYSATSLSSSAAFGRRAGRSAASSLGMPRC